MTVMADGTFRAGPARSRTKTLTQAALNADMRVEQVDDLLDGLGKTMLELSSSLSALNSAVERLEGGLDHLEGTLSSLDDLARPLIALVKTVMSPLSLTEHAVRGVLDRLRHRTAR